ncbi:signal peptidase I [Methanococcoides sp. FTZ1]|uniref:signal peptidase I n=1 Tax=Methanococcoides sp. FTZ1 TaxID=3439061 RepID=UPI003F87CA42
MKKNNTCLAMLSILILIVGVTFVIPVITGATQVLIVLSGSMDPVMRPGDMVVVKSISPDQLEVGDVIAYNDPGGDSDTLITHRILSIEEGEERVFQTKGDANKGQDIYTVPASKLVGKMVFVIPFAGYFVEASKGSLMVLITIILPAFVLIMDEVKKIIQYSNSVTARKLEREKRKPVRARPHIVHGRVLGGVVLTTLLVLMMLVAPNLGGNGNTNLDGEYVFRNDGYLSSVSVITPGDTTEVVNIESWYSVLPPVSESLVKTTSDPMRVGVTSVPYVLPVLWIILLAQVNPYLPVFFIVVLYSSLAVVISMPLWFRKARTKSQKRYLIIRNMSRRLRKLQFI